MILKFNICCINWLKFAYDCIVFETEHDGGNNIAPFSKYS